LLQQVEANKGRAMRKAGAGHWQQGCTGAILIIVVAWPSANAMADEPTAAPAEFGRGLVELKRQATSRGTPEEATKTNLKFDYFPREGAASLLRVELPFPNHKATFTGSAFDPNLGDDVVCVGFRAFDVQRRLVTSFVEMTFLTANPASQGTGVP
jgi:hypothetical protein